MDDGTTASVSSLFSEAALTMICCSHVTSSPSTRLPFCPHQRVIVLSRSYWPSPIKSRHSAWCYCFRLSMIDIASRCRMTAHILLRLGTNVVKFGFLPSLF